MVILLLAAAAAAAQPSADALRLGRALAEHGTLAAMLPVIEQQNVNELLAENKSLSASEQAKLRVTAERMFVKGRERLLGATGRAYAERLSVADLRRLVAFYRTPTAARFQAVVPQAIAATMQSVGQMDFKADVRTAFCTETAKLCAK